MALRVLLADESPTIKKVFQLSLQDYGVEVKSVSVGVDVLEVAKIFKPDIVFADVLLQQLSGYQVSSELKADEKFSSLPVVLMWSGFMEIDEDKFQASLADSKLEKPFEVDRLREIIQTLVPKVQTQKLSEFLEFPDLPDFAQENKTKPIASPQKATPPQKTTLPQTKPAPAPKQTVNPPLAAKVKTEDFKKQIQEVNKATNASQWNMEEFEPLDLSSQMDTRIPDSEIEKNSHLLSEQDDDSEWIQSNLSNFKLGLSEAENVSSEDDEIPMEKIISHSAIEEATRGSSLIPPIPQRSKKHEDLELEVEPIHNAAALDITQFPQLSEDRLLEIIRGQSKDIIERVVWKVVPEIASQIIERELHRLLEERVNNEKRV
jgi:two-component system cell cycle response regulator